MVQSISLDVSQEELLTVSTQRQLSLNLEQLTLSLRPSPRPGASTAATRHSEET
jgi:hypothetical protein